MALIPGTPEFEVYHSLAADRHGRWLERYSEDELKELVERMGLEFRRGTTVASRHASRHARSFRAN